MERPSKIKIGARDYSVNWVDDKWCLANDRNGEIKYISREITVCETLQPVDMAIVFLHEIIHAIHGHYSRCSDRPIPREEAAEWAGEGLVMVWRDNPDVFAWWSSLIQKTDANQ